MAVSTHLSIITLNANGSNAPIKRYTVAEWITNKILRYGVHKRPSSDQKTYRWKVMGWKKIFHENVNKQTKLGY